MTLFNKLFLGTALLITGVACNDGIDPISKVDAGPDTAEPTVVISQPSQNKINIPFTDVATDLEIAFLVTDDIEIKKISLRLNGEEVESYSTFTDYRRASRTYIYDNLPVGTHTLEVVAEDMAGKTKSISRTIEITNVYEPILESEIFYMPFEANANVDLISLQPASSVGSPGFADGKFGKAYLGAAGAYLTFPLDELKGEEFTAAFWYKLNSTPDRAGVLTVSQPDPSNNYRNTGFRLFREGGGTFKLNVGTGTGEAWVEDPKMVIPASSSDWHHIAFTISATSVVVYFDGAEAKQISFTGISWGNGTAISIGSGAPNFTEWGHLSDQSRIDDLRIFNKALTQEEINSIIGD